MNLSAKANAPWVPQNLPSTLEPKKWPGKPSHANARTAHLGLSQGNLRRILKGGLPRGSPPCPLQEGAGRTS